MRRTRSTTGGQWARMPPTKMAPAMATPAMSRPNRDRSRIHGPDDTPPDSPESGCGLMSPRAPVAQWIERLPPEQKAVGSNPAGRASSPHFGAQQAHLPVPQVVGRFPRLHRASTYCCSSEDPCSRLSPLSHLRWLGYRRSRSRHGDDEGAHRCLKFSVRSAPPAQRRSTRRISAKPRASSATNMTPNWLMTSSNDRSSKGSDRPSACAHSTGLMVPTTRAWSIICWLRSVAVIAVVESVASASDRVTTPVPAAISSTEDGRWSRSLLVRSCAYDSNSIGTRWRS